MASGASCRSASITTNHRASADARPASTAACCPTLSAAAGRRYACLPRRAAVRCSTTHRGWRPRRAADGTPARRRPSRHGPALRGPAASRRSVDGHHDGDIRARERAGKARHPVVTPQTGARPRQPTRRRDSLRTSRPCAAHRRRAWPVATSRGAARPCCDPRTGVPRPRALGGRRRQRSRIGRPIVSATHVTTASFELSWPEPTLMTSPVAIQAHGADDRVDHVSDEHPVARDGSARDGKRRAVERGANRGRQQPVPRFPRTVHVEQTEHGDGHTRFECRLPIKHRRRCLRRAVDGRGIDGCVLGEGRVARTILERAARDDHALHVVLARQP